MATGGRVARTWRRLRSWARYLRGPRDPLRAANDRLREMRFGGTNPHHPLCTGGAAKVRWPRPDEWERLKQLEEDQRMGGGDDDVL